MAKGTDSGSDPRRQVSLEALRIGPTGFLAPQSRVVKKSGALKRESDELLTQMSQQGHAGAKRELKRRYGDQTPEQYWGK